LIDNYCRNPDKEKTIWCYTTDAKKRWEYCEPLECDAGAVKEPERPKDFKGVDKETGLEYGRGFYVISRMPMNRVLEISGSNMVIKTLKRG
jgi:hypothetical protein